MHQKLDAVALGKVRLKFVVQNETWYHEYCLGFMRANDVQRDVGIFLAIFAIEAAA